MNLSNIAGIAVPLACLVAVAGDIPRPDDAPPPLDPDESAKLVALPPGFRLELVASEPLIQEPAGVCFDEQGRLFVCELHGYNLEGQLDIEELNKTGQLDREVRRIPADERFQRAAESGTYGTLKRLIDADGDGRMDRAEVWADRLPPCYGLVPARGGLIVVCAPHILYLADEDGDGKAEVQQTLFTGFETGALERGINGPQWGLDGWIYVGNGRGGKVTGPNLKTPVELGRSDFRIQADGSAIEPVTGATGTMGFALTESDERFVVSTRTPGIYVAPIEWRYLARNPNMATPSLERDASSGNRVYPISRPHPWRTRRAEDPGFSKFYSDKYGSEESSPNGYFTSACSPFVYLDNALPGLSGQLLACEPAQNLIHRAIVARDGVALTLKRPPGEETKEFLASADPWFHPITLSHGPDGAVWICDFYREIIEDYSAIPRYLQQQYGVVNGHDRGRIWRLVHDSMPAAPNADMSGLSADELANEIASSYSWRRQTAKRLLVERDEKGVVAKLEGIARESEIPAVMLTALHTLDDLHALDECGVRAALQHGSPLVRVHALRFSEGFLKNDDSLLGEVMSLADDPEAIVQLQTALTLGASDNARVAAGLADLARKHGDVPWMPTAILSSASRQAGKILAELLRPDADMGKALPLLEPLAFAMGAGREPHEMSHAILAIAADTDRGRRLACLRGLRQAFRSQARVEIPRESVQAMKAIAEGDDRELRALARSLIHVLSLEDPRERLERIAKAAERLADAGEWVELRVAAVEELSAEEDPSVADALLAAFSGATPRVREAILAALFANRERLASVVQAVENNLIPAASLSAVQRLALVEHPDATVRKRAAKAFASLVNPDAGATRKFVEALKEARDIPNGGAVFREKCANCHQAHGLGIAVGPDLSAEFQRAEEAIVQDVVAPSAAIAAGYTTHAVATSDGRVASGLLVAESAGTLTIREPGGKETVILRKEIDDVKALPVSLMPEDLARTLSPKDLADVIGWLRRPPASIVLLDDNQSILSALDQGGGIAEFVSRGPYAGLSCLRVTPLQRHSPRIRGWAFPIREKPSAGEYRYLRYAWKSDGAAGVMIELATDGHWPSAKAAPGRYFAGANSTGWQATQVSDVVPKEWTVVTRDLWSDLGDCTLTGIAPTAIDGPALFDRIELLPALELGAACRSPTTRTENPLSRKAAKTQGPTKSP